MSTSKTDRKSHHEMSPEEREKEHVRRLQEEVDAVKSGVLRRGRRASEPAGGTEGETSE